MEHVTHRHRYVNVSQAIKEQVVINMSVIQVSTRVTVRKTKTTTFIII